MTPDPPDPLDPDAVAEGRQLVRLGGDRGLSLAERLSEHLDRLTWRTPLHSLRLKGRYPLKLIAVPDDPLVGVVARGQALLGGAMEYRGERHSLSAIDPARPDWGRGFGDYYHGFAWLRDLSTVAPRGVGAPIAEALMARWLAQHGDRVDAVAWAPGLWGRRILFWAMHAPLILSSADIVYRSRVLNVMARGARHLDRAADKGAPGPARIAGWCGVVAAGLLIPGGDPRRAFGEGGLLRALAQSQFDDGGSVSRSPVALMDVVALLSCLRECYAARGEALPDPVDTALVRGVAALLGTTAADRGLCSWQGGRPVSPERLAQVIEASRVRARPLRQSRDWGYQRLAAAGAVVVVDAAPPPVARVVDGGCASTLAFELSDAGGRLVVNCGGARGGVARLPRELCEGLRTTAAHSTLTIADANSTAIHADGTLGRGVTEVRLARAEHEAGSRIEASHDGYVRRFGMVHRRQLVLAADGRELRGEDVLLPAGRRVRAGGYALRFHLGEGVGAEATPDGQGAVLRTATGDLWHYRCRGAALGIEPSVWIDEGGRPRATQQLVASGEAAAGGASVSWAFRRVL